MQGAKAYRREVLRAVAPAAAGDALHVHCRCNRSLRVAAEKCLTRTWRLRVASPTPGLDRKSPARGKRRSVPPVRCRRNSAWYRSEGRASSSSFVSREGKAVLDAAVACISEDPLLSRAQSRQRLGRLPPFFGRPRPAVWAGLHQDTGRCRRCCLQRDSPPAAPSAIRIGVDAHWARCLRRARRCGQRGCP